MTHAHLTLQSKNKKTNLPTSTTESATCPPSCGHFKTCYAKAGPLAMHWRKVSKLERGLSWADFCDEIKSLPRRTIWRHNQAGDLPGRGNRINTRELRDLVEANRGRRGFTYTHKPLTPTNLAAIREANNRGFTINISADRISDVARLMQHGLPVASVAPSDAPRKIRLRNGQVSIGCPAAYVDGVTCATCANGRPFCADPKRTFAIHFPAHGVAKRRASEIAE